MARLNGWDSVTLVRRSPNGARVIYRYPVLGKLHKIRHQTRLFDLLHSCDSLTGVELDELLLLVNVR